MNISNIYSSDSNNKCMRDQELAYPEVISTIKTESTIAQIPVSEVKRLSAIECSSLDIGSTIDSGEYGVVKKVKNIPGCQSDVNGALKITKFNNLSLQEISLHKSLDHINITKVLAYNISENRIMNIMELIPKTLYDLFNKHEDPLMKDKIKIMSGICAATSYINKNFNYIHGDLKENNILITEDLTPKVTDFGLSYILGKSVCFFDPGCFYLAPEASISNRKERPSLLITTKLDSYALSRISMSLITFKEMSMPWATADKMEKEAGLNYHFGLQSAWYDKYHQKKFSSNIFDYEKILVSHLTQNCSLEDVRSECKIQGEHDKEYIDIILKKISFPAMDSDPYNRPDPSEMHAIFTCLYDNFKNNSPAEFNIP